MEVSAVLVRFFFLLTYGLCGTGAAASDSAADVTCSVQLLPDGSTKYELSRPPRLMGCDRKWEDKKSTNIAINDGFVRQLAENVTNSSITLKHCEDYMRHTEDCFHQKDDLRSRFGPDVKIEISTVCQVNCSLLFEKHHPLTNASVTSTCLLKGLCLDQLTIGLVSGSILFLILCALAGVSIWKFVIKRRQRSQTAIQATAYTQVNEEVKIGQLDSERLQMVTVEGGK